MSSSPEMTNLFQFMELRAPFSPEAKSLRQSYIRDDFIGLRGDNPDRIDTDLQSANSPSAIGRLVYEMVFCGHGQSGPEYFNALLTAVLGLLTPYVPSCPDHEVANPLSITELEQHSYLIDRDQYYLLPERMEQIEGLPLFPELRRALDAIERSRQTFSPANPVTQLKKLVTQLESTFNIRPLRSLVFEQGVHTEEFVQAKRMLFDTLYLLYILRRFKPVNLEHVIDGLRVLHVIEALSIDSLIREIKKGSLSRSDESLKKTIEAIFPELQGWDGSAPLQTLPLIQTKADFEAYFKAMPVIHPIFARLLNYTKPFNDLKPIGIGDLKVVKQWLAAYQPGEISYVENVLKGEVKDRTHRRLEKTEESFSFSSSTKESSQKDIQATERFELKSEIDNIVKTELGLSANTATSASYTNQTYGYTLTGSFDAHFSYKRDATEQSKLSSTFARETVAKAVEQIEKNVSETRSITKLFETEETNKHKFQNNKDGAGHITGIYRWLDKKYKAQLFNYGRRMMFEFIVPEPAAFFVESRLHAFEASLDCPQLPQAPVLKTLSLGFIPSNINEIKFQELRQKYDLAEFTFPNRTRRISFINPSTGENLFQEREIGADGVWYAKTFPCRLNVKGYSLFKLIVNGFMEYRGTGEQNQGLRQYNTLEIYLNGTRVHWEQHEDWNGWPWNPDKPLTPETPVLFTNDDVILTIGYFDIKNYYLSIHAELNLDEQTLLDWQTQVFNKVKAIEQQNVDKENQEALLAYNSQMATYRNRLAELKATSLIDLIQGGSSAFNREIIRTELKKHCLTLLTKDFDADPTDDLLTKIDAVQNLHDDFTFHKFKVKESSTPTTASFEEVTKSIDYPSIELDEAKKKGRFVQFLEQAFEWQQLAYIFHPYFWASRPKWIEMMSRLDDGDPHMTAFLQAGSARVLFAVTPGYENAVLHFLATREPWEGGQAPVIGDPLFIPLHEELRKQQDDLYNAVPEGEPWSFVLPTSLVYLEDSGATLPTFPDPPTR